jgi:hypothetical protein
MKKTNHFFLLTCQIQLSIIISPFEIKNNNGSQDNILEQKSAHG